jgi:SAM-dependent methyltransferase
MRRENDVFGRALMDWARGGTAPEILERDDGYTDLSAGHELYVAGFEDWPLSERQAIRYVRGRVVDVGCGAGRVSSYLQQRGFDVVGLDASPLAVRAARLRGEGGMVPIDRRAAQETRIIRHYCSIRKQLRALWLSRPSTEVTWRVGR